ncbi:MAG: hypothetical protein DHS20C18_10810 [Saprospiraceae bacterium]|nr:MAG: hypothetical protein DHS20C18_10810 [Saprospiraceae bacterium]
MNFHAISSARGKIKKLMISYNGSKPSLAFIKDALRVFPEDMELLIWINHSTYRPEIEREVHYANKINCIVIPEEVDFVSDDESEVNLAPSIGSVWIRDRYCVSQKNGDWGMIHSGENNIPVVLINKGIIQHKIKVNRALVFGNILIDKDFLFIGVEDLRLIETYTNDDLSPETYLTKILFPGTGTNPKIVPLGFEIKPPSEALTIAPDPKWFNILNYFRHTDSVLTPTGIDFNGAPVVLVGQVRSPNTLYRQYEDDAEVLMKKIISQLEKENIIVLRNPIPLLKLEDGEPWVGYFNNGIVETTNDTRRVWLPKFEVSSPYENYLNIIGEQNKAIWESLGFEVYWISGGMMSFSTGGGRAGALHCLTVEFR